MNAVARTNNADSVIGWMTHRSAQFFEQNWQEIKADPVLRFYGSFLSLTHVLTFLYWNESGNQILAYARGRLHICWPIFPQCGALVEQTPNWLIWIVDYGYLALALTNVVLFLLWKDARLRWAYFLAIFLLFLKLGIFLTDYRFMGNYHYMVYWAGAAFLFFPSKKKSLMLLVPLFYVAAGVLKFNTEWMAGQAFLKPLPWFSPKQVEILCAYVPYLEIVVAWGLIAMQPVLFWGALFQFLLFHFISFFVVGWYYPLTMSCLLSVYVLERILSGQDGIPRLKAKISGHSLVFLSVFALCQLLPFFYRGDSALTGQGRMFSLNMLDAMSECHDYIYLRYKDGRTIEAERSTHRLGVRIHCDPLVLFAEGKRYCDLNRGDRNFIDLDMSLTSKRKTDTGFVSVFTVRDFCEKKLVIDWLGGLPKLTESR